MNLHYACIAIFAPLFALVGASEEAQCCYPMKLSGEALIHGNRLNRFYIDYERGMIVEDWAGKLMTDKVVYDLKNEKRYRIRTDGSCNEYDLTTVGNYARCMPEDTEVIGTNEDEVSYGYQLKDVSIVKTLEKDTCMPRQISKTKGRRRVVLQYEARAGIRDESVFNINLDHCGRG